MTSARCGCAAKPQRASRLVFWRTLKDMGLVFFTWIFTILVLALEGYAFVDVWRRPLGAFPAVSTWPKMAWLIVFGVGVLLNLAALPVVGWVVHVPGFWLVNSFIRLAALLLVIYYLTDVRTKLNSLS
jgi:hypothetical protein